MDTPGRDDHPKVVLQAHAIRTRTALAILLHAGDRGPRSLRNPLASLLGGVVVAVLIILAVVVGGQLSDVLPDRG